MEKLKTTQRTKLKSARDRAIFDREALYQIFDEAKIAHIGFSSKGGTYVIPMSVWRQGNELYIHGNRANRILTTLTQGVECCVTATMIDSIVLAKSAFRHAANYRSAVVFGQFRQLKDANEINESLRCFMESIAPGRWGQVRRPTKKELDATSILAIDLDEASVKSRCGPGTIDDPSEKDLPVWTGELKLKQTLTEMVPDAHTVAGTATPDYSEVW